MARNLHDVFRVRLRADAFLPVETQWAFRLYDNEAQVDIERPADAIAASQLPLEELRRELMFKYVVCDCAVAVYEARGRPDEPKTYSCELCVVKCNANGDTLAVWFSLILSPSQGITGTYQAMADEGEDPDTEDDGDAVDNMLPVVVWWHAAREPVQLRLAPLTYGTYTLEGAILDDEVEGMLVPAILHLELLPGGQLVGQSEEHYREAGPEMIELMGSWTRNGIEMFKSYGLGDGASDIFLYRGEVSEFSFSGHWVNVESDAVQDVELVISQRFDMHVTKMQRHWSPLEHRYFPDDFHVAVKLCLYSSLHGGKGSLPGEVWIRVFEFCDSEWFT